MQDKIIAAIAEYLYHFTESTNDLKKVRFLKSVRHDKTREDFLQEIATEIAAAVAPMVEEKDLPLSELFTHMSEQHDLTLTDTELADIIQVSRGK